MFKIFSHIQFQVKKLLTLFSIILFSANVFAQGDLRDSIAATDTVVKDSVYDSEASEELSRFDSLTSFTIPSYHPVEIHDSVLKNLKKELGKKIV